MVMFTIVMASILYWNIQPKNVDRFVISHLMISVDKNLFCCFEYILDQSFTLSAIFGNVMIYSGSLSKVFSVHLIVDIPKS